MVTKEIFIKVLEVLECKNCIDSFDIFEKENTIKVWSYYGDGDEVIYHFDENNNLINPKVYEIQKQIDKLIKEKNKLENELKILKNEK